MVYSTETPRWFDRVLTWNLRKPRQQDLLLMLKHIDIEDDPHAVAAAQVLSTRNRPVRWHNALLYIKQVLS